MSRITRVNYIKGFRVFRDFSWPSSLPEFSQFNLIYGLNGSGKSALSDLFQRIQTGASLIDGKAEFRIDGVPIQLHSLPERSTLPKVRVFNKQFVEQAVFAASAGDIAPVFYFGKNSVDLQKKVEALQKDLSKVKDDKAKNERTFKKETKELDDFCSQQAKRIKELLRSPGTNAYANYDKSSIKPRLAALAGSPSTKVNLSEEQRDTLLTETRASIKESITEITTTLPDIDALTSRVRDALQQTVVSNVLFELAGNPNLANWVQDGLKLHTGGNKSDVCHFCGASISRSRLKELEAHFNDQYQLFLKTLEDLEDQITEANQWRKDFQPPTKTGLYDNLTESYATLQRRLDDGLSEMSTRLAALSVAVQQKRAKPFDSIDLENYIDPNNKFDRSATEQIIGKMNALIAQHNAKSKNFESNKTSAKRKLEECYILDALPEYKRASASVDGLSTAVKRGQEEIERIEKEVKTLESQFVEHQRPAEELTSELACYLGRQEITFEVAKNGYSIMRGDVRATNLSDGERTAIAFLYFLKTLQDKEFHVDKDIVVIDDPVSSLDSTALFSAFGYMKERTRKANQLFVLTHNLSFFRQVKNWFDYVNKKDQSQFYMLQCVRLGNQRNGVIASLDRMLKKYESEYHYLFAQVFEIANSSTPDADLGIYYGVPNIARRVLESFLGYKYPSKIGHAYQQVESSKFDEGKRIKLLRFTNTYSHDSTVGDQEYDPSLLAETPQIMRDLLDFIEFEDKHHYNEMIGIVRSGQQVASSAAGGNLTS